MAYACIADAEETRSELRNRAIGIIFQSFNLLPVLSALENVMLPRQIQGQPSAKAGQKVVQRLTELA